MLLFGQGVVSSPEHSLLWLATLTFRNEQGCMSRGSMVHSPAVLACSSDARKDRGMLVKCFQGDCGASVSSPEQICAKLDVFRIAGMECSMVDLTAVVEGWRSCKRSKGHTLVTGIVVHAILCSAAKSACKSKSSARACIPPKRLRPFKEGQQ